MTLEYLEITEMENTKKSGRVPRRRRGMLTLMKSDDLNVTFNRKKRTIEATMRIELERYPAYNNRLINLMQQISQCFASNQTTFLKQSR